MNWVAPAIDVCVDAGGADDDGEDDGDGYDDGDGDGVGDPTASFGSVRLLGSTPHVAMVPCVFPPPLCPPAHTLRHELEDAPPVSLDVALTIAPDAVDS